MACQAATFKWVGGNGNWSVPANWESVFPDPPGIPGPPGAADTAVIHSGSVNIDGYISVAELTLDAAAQMFIDSGLGLRTPSIYNDGLITLNWGGFITPSATNYSMDLTGSGSVVLIPAPNQYCPSASIGYDDGIFTHGPSHTIRGGGRINSTVQNYGRIIAEKIGDSFGNLALYRGCTGSPDSVLAANGSNCVIDLIGNGIWYSGGQILPQDGCVRSWNGSFRNIYFGPGVIGDCGSMGNNFYEGVTFAQGAQVIFSTPMNICASSGNTVFLTNNGTIAALAGISTPNIATFNGTGTISGSLDGAGVGGSFINDVGHTLRLSGVLQCDLTNNGTLILNSLSIYAHVSGAGPVIVPDNGSLAFQTDASGALLQAGDLSMAPKALLYWYSDSTIDLKKNFSFSMTSLSGYGFSLNPNCGNFQMSGGGASQQTLEVGGWDYGLDGNGFTGSNHFRLPKLSLLGGGTYVSLVDNVDNGNRSSGQPEALYLATTPATNLSVPPGTTLNLNNLHLYCYLNGEMHQVKAGEGDLFGGGQIINRSLKPCTAPINLLLSD